MARKNTIKNQETQLDYMERILLFQHKLSNLSICWRVTDKQVDTYSHKLTAFRRKFRHTEEPDLRAGRITVSKTQTGRMLYVTVDRPQGMYSKRFTETSPEWSVFEQAIRSMLSKRFEFVLSSGDG